MLPVLLLPLVAGWGGITLAAELVYQGIAVAILLPFLGAAGALAAVLVRFKKRRLFSKPLLTLLAFSLGFGLGTQFYGNLTEQAQHYQELIGEQELIVIDDTSNYLRSRGSEALVLRSDGTRVRVRVFWNDTALELPKGSLINADCSFTPLRDDQRWLYERGCIGTLSISVRENRGFTQDLWGAIDRFRHDNSVRIESIGGSGAALLAGVLLGNREQLQGSDVRQDFITCGLAHLIAVSGTHLAVVAALLSWFLRRLTLGRATEVALLLLVLVLYVILTGLQPSAIRSAIMAGVAACSVFIGRRGHAPSALTAAALIMLLLYPANAYSLGFWLSVCAVVGISFFANLVSHWISTAVPLGRAKSPGAFSQALALTIAASSATLPLAVPAFGVLSLIGPLANLLGGPLISLALVCGALSLVLTPLIEPLGMFLLQAAAFSADICARVAALFSQIPWASIPLEIPLPVACALGVSAALLVYYSWPAPTGRVLRRATLAILMAACLTVQLAPAFITPRLTVMDIGQGDALLIQERRAAILIDTGASESALVHALARCNIHHLQAVIITHLDSDHAGALRRLRGLVNVETVYFARGLLEHQANNEYLTDAYAVVGKEQVQELQLGDRLKIGDTLCLTVLWPTGTAFEGSNEESICLLLQYDANNDGIAEQQTLLTGDAESETLSLLIKRYPDLRADILKVGHHGSRKSLLPAQLESLGTTTALISVGANNRYGHPAQEILDTLEASEVRTLRTDERGDITCLFKGTALVLRYATMTGDSF
jgi:competence protein ComEC